MATTVVTKAASGRITLIIQTTDIIHLQTEIVCPARRGATTIHIAEELNVMMGIAVGGKKENAIRIRSEPLTMQICLPVKKVSFNINLTHLLINTPAHPLS